MTDLSFLFIPCRDTTVIKDTLQRIASVDGGISGDAKPENVKAVIEAVKKYGTY